MAAKFQVMKGPTGKYRFVVLSSKGQVVATSEAYERKASALAGIKAVQKIVSGAAVEDTTNPWATMEIDQTVVDRFADALTPCTRAVELGADLVGDPHREDDEGCLWTRLSMARRVADVVPGSVVVLGSPIGRYLATVVAWDFEVDPDDPIVVLDLLPIRPSAVERLLERNRTPVA